MLHDGTTTMQTDDQSTNWTMFGSVGAALAAAACCLGPVLLVSLGVGGAWVGSLSALEPYRPLFMAVAFGFLGFGFYRVYGQSRQEDCGDGAECEVPRASLANRVSLWVATVAVVGLFSSPYLLSLGLGEAAAESGDARPTSVEADETADRQAGAAELSSVALEVDGMTCAGCVRTLDSTLGDLDGVEQVEVTLEPPRAEVTYDDSRVDVDDLIEATEGVGYSAKVRN